MRIGKVGISGVIFLWQKCQQPKSGCLEEHPTLE